MSDSDNPNYPELDQATDHTRGPSAFAISLIVVVCTALTFLLTPADIFYYIIGIVVLNVLALSSYFAGYFRASNAISIIVVVCFALAFLLTPADPFSYTIGIVVLNVLALSSYFAGYFRASKK